eukprot:g11952.t1
MFGQRFEASKLCGGFSGSLVLRVQPYDGEGLAEEPVIVKLDKGGPIRDRHQENTSCCGPVTREEVENSLKVYDVLQDRAAKVLGEPLFYFDADQQAELGAFKLELAGACWQVPEFASISCNNSLLSTFKDLFLYYSSKKCIQLLPKNFAIEELPPFGNVMMVITEILGSGGMLRQMRHNANAAAASDYLQKRASVAVNLLQTLSGGGATTGTTTAGTGIGGGAISAQPFTAEQQQQLSDMQGICSIKRSSKTVFEQYNLKGKDTAFNPFFQLTENKNGYQKIWPFCEQLYAEIVGGGVRPSATGGSMGGNMHGMVSIKTSRQIMPDVRRGVLELKERLKRVAASELSQTQKRAYMPLHALGHGDLNAANLLVDAMDAIWMIDFATSTDMPLCNDLAKLEVALLFEYTILPITCDMLLRFAGVVEVDQINAGGRIGGPGGRGGPSAPSERNAYAAADNYREDFSSSQMNVAIGHVKSDSKFQRRSLGHSMKTRRSSSRKSAPRPPGRENQAFPGAGQRRRKSGAAGVPMRRADSSPIMLARGADSFFSDDDANTSDGYFSEDSMDEEEAELEEYRSMWRGLNVGDWFSVPTEIVVNLLSQLKKLDERRAAFVAHRETVEASAEMAGVDVGEKPRAANLFRASLITHERELDEVILSAVSSFYSDRQSNSFKKAVRQLKARLTVDETCAKTSFAKMKEGLQALVRGNLFQKTMDDISTTIQNWGKSASLGGSRDRMSQGRGGGGAREGGRGGLRSNADGLHSARTGRESLEVGVVSATMREVVSSKEEQNPSTTVEEGDGTIRVTEQEQQEAFGHNLNLNTNDSVMFTLRQIARLRKLSNEDWKHTLKRLSQHAQQVAQERPQSMVQRGGEHQQMASQTAGQSRGSLDAAQLLGDAAGGSADLPRKRVCSSRTELR